NVATDASVDLQVRAASLKVAPDLSGDRRGRGADDDVPSDTTVAQDGQLIAGGEEIVRDLAIEDDRVARGTHGASDLSADRDAVPRRDHIAGDRSIDADVAAGRDEVAVDRSADRDIRTEGVEVVFDRLARADRDVLTLADVGRRGRHPPGSGHHDRLERDDRRRPLRLRYEYLDQRND